MGLGILGANTESAVYQVSNSLRFNDNDDPKLQRTTGSNSARDRFTFAAWVKKAQDTGADQTLFSANDGGHQPHIKFDNTTEQLNVRISDSAGYNVKTSRSFRDVAAWYHIVVAMNTQQDTAADRIKIYVNGVQETSFSTSDYPAENYNSAFNSNTEHTLGRDVTSDNKPFDGYMAEVYWIDGLQLDPTYFGKFNSNNVWIPVEKDKGAGGAITFGTHGFYFEFKQTGTGTNSSGMGADTSGNDNHFAVTNLQTDGRNVTTDTPTNNFITLNPLATNSRGTFSDGNTKVTLNLQGSDPYGQIEFGTFAVNKGKWYYEVYVVENGAGGQVAIGWNERWEGGSYTNGHNNLGSNGNAWYGDDGQIKIGSATTQSTGVDTFADTDIIGCAIDLDNNKVYWHKNGNYQDDPTPAPASNNGRSLGTATYNNYWTPWVSKDSDNSSHNPTLNFNFGNGINVPSSGNADANGYGNFEYDVPAGFYSLCTKNLAEFG